MDTTIISKPFLYNQAALSVETETGLNCLLNDIKNIFGEEEKKEKQTQDFELYGCGVIPCSVLPLLTGTCGSCLPLRLLKGMSAEEDCMGLPG